MKYILGIGNPGREYDKTRHNVGFQLVDRLVKAGKTKGLTLAKPATYVNRTGEYVNQKKIQGPDLLVVCDDVNLPLGTLRLRAKGSSGGHKGLQSIIDALGDGEFARLRIGVGSEKMPKDLAKFVLAPFTRAEATKLETVLDRETSVCETWFKSGLDEAQIRLSLLMNEKEQ